MIVADTSGLLALFNVREPAHSLVRRVVDESDEPLIVSPFVVAELDYLVATRLGTTEELQVLEELAGGACDSLRSTVTTSVGAPRSSTGTATRMWAWPTHPWSCWRTATRLVASSRSTVATSTCSARSTVGASRSWAGDTCCPRLLAA